MYSCFLNLVIALKILSNNDDRKFEKKLPSSMTVLKLRTLIQRLFRIDEDFSLYYISQKVSANKSMKQLNP